MVLSKFSFMVYGGKSNGFLINGGNPGTDSFVISDVGDFFVTHIQFSATSPLITLQIQVSVKNVFDRAIFMPLIAGYVPFPTVITIPTATPYTNVYQYPSFPLPIRRGIVLRFPMKANISLNYTDLSGINNMVFTSFMGYEVPQKSY